MTADELFKAGQLQEAISAQTAAVKKSPTDVDARYMLFVLLCFAGELERADKALDVLANQDQKIQTGTLVYHQLLASEWERRKVYEDNTSPVLPPDAPAYASLRIEALTCLRAGDADAAERKLDEAVELTPECHGKLNGEAFEALRDYDDVLGSVFEIFAGGRYIWMPISQVRSMQFSEPETALDTLWRQVKLEDSDGVVADVHLPVLYQPSYGHDHDAVKLGRMTDWQERGELYAGVGQHLFLAIRGGERFEESLMDFRSLELEVAS
jgi:type VI secretion system protein ImpE